MHLRGLDGELDDCDFRICHPDLTYVYEQARHHLPYPVTLRGARAYEKGSYDSACIEIQAPTPIGICSEMNFTCDLGHITLPTATAEFEDTELLAFEELKLPVASVEKLLLYYLLLRRGSQDGKMILSELPTSSTIPAL